MKKVITVISVILAFYSTVAAQGSVYRSGEFVRISKSDSIANQLMAAGQTVEMFGWLGNDLFSAAEVVSVDGTISDDALIAGRQVTIRGSVGDLLMGVGETVLIDGDIQGDLFAAGREVRIARDARIGGNVHIAAASIVLDGGTVEGIFRAAGQSFTLNGTVGNKTELYGNNITFGSDYRAEYGTDIYSDEPVYRENLGNVPPDLNITVSESSALPGIFFKTGFYLSLLVTGLILIWVFHRSATDLYRFANEQFWKNTGTGLLAFLLIPLAAFILILLVFTIPLSFILMVLYALALLVSYLLVAMILGVRSILFFRDEATPSTYYWGLVLGMVIVAILVNLPFVGWLFNAILIFFGLGSLVYYFWTMRDTGYSRQVI